MCWKKNIIQDLQGLIELGLDVCHHCNRTLYQNKEKNKKKLNIYIYIIRIKKKVLRLLRMDREIFLINHQINEIFQYSSSSHLLFIFQIKATYIITSQTHSTYNVRWTYACDVYFHKTETSNKKNSQDRKLTESNG